MKNIIEVTGGPGGSSFLLVGTEKTALIDCGMAYCAPKLIQNCQDALGTRTLDYILISHSHYDHIGAVPFLREKWPTLEVLGAEHAKRILSRPNALQTIRRLSEQAASVFGVRELPLYEDVAFRVDRAIRDGERLRLGGLDLQVVETLGHTQCSLSFLVNGDILFASESTGCYGSSGKVHPAFIRSYSEAVASIHICKRLRPRLIISPHYGFLSEKETPAYWDKCLQAAQEARAFILAQAEKGCGEAEIYRRYEAVFRDEDNQKEQPLEAFRLNTEAMIQAVLREEYPEKRETAVS